MIKIRTRKAPSEVLLRDQGTAEQAKVGLIRHRESGLLIEHGAFPLFRNKGGENHVSDRTFLVAIQPKYIDGSGKADGGRDRASLVNL
jgi:hypothetical protein